MSKFSVISTSGWQGDVWSLVAYADTRKEAEKKRKQLSHNDAKSTGYITSIIGKTKVCQDHGLGCVIGDTSRVKVIEYHLKNKKCHIKDGCL